MDTRERTRRLTLMAMFAALSYVVMAVGRIPISSVDFLKYDPKDFILAICGFIMGPIPALLVTTVVSFIEMITVSGTGIIGFFMNVLGSAAFVCTASVIYKRRHSLRGAMAGLLAGVIVSTAVMLLWNYFITPLYMNFPREAIAEMLVPVFLPFNLIKGGINAAVTLLVYKPVSRALKQTGLVAKSPAAQPAQKKSALGAYIIAGMVLVSCITAVLVIRGII